MTPAAGIGLALLVGGGAYVGWTIYQRRKGAAASGSQDPCAGLDGDLKTACQAAVAGGKLLSTIINALPDDHANNVKLNGPVTKSIPQAFLDAHPGIIDPNNGPIAYPDLEYANGCVPYAGHPQWGKCAPGTVDMAVVGGAGAFGADADPRNCADHIGTGATRCDPTTLGPLNPGDPGYQDCGAASDAWWVAGVKECVPKCASGSSRVGADNRTGGGTVDHPVLAACFADQASVDRTGAALPAGGAVPPTGPIAGTGTRTSTGGARIPGTSPPGFVWVAAPLPGHWERQHA